MIYKNYNEAAAVTALAGLTLLAATIGGSVYLLKKDLKTYNDGKNLIKGSPSKALKDIPKKSLKYRKLDGYSVSPINTNKALELLNIDRDSDEFASKIDDIKYAYVFKLKGKIIAIYFLDKRNSNFYYTYKILDNRYWDKDSKTFIEAAIECETNNIGSSAALVFSNVYKYIYNYISSSEFNNDSKNNFDDINKSYYYCTKNEFKMYEKYSSDTISKIRKLITNCKDKDIKIKINPNKDSNKLNIHVERVDKKDEWCDIQDIMYKIDLCMKENKFKFTGRYFDGDDENYIEIYNYTSKNPVSCEIELKSKDGIFATDISISMNISSQVKVQECGMFNEAIFI